MLGGSHGRDAGRSQIPPSDVDVRNRLRQCSSQATMPWDNFAIELKDAEFTEGSDGKLVAKTKLHGKDFMWFVPEVTWFRGDDEDEIPVGGRVRTCQNMEGLFELVFSPVTMDDRGLYSVRASYATAVVRDTASLSVKRGFLADFSQLYFLSDYDVTKYGFFFLDQSSEYRVSRGQKLH